jgi:hypothetical protein
MLIVHGVSWKEGAMKEEKGFIRRGSWIIGNVCRIRHLGLKKSAQTRGAGDVWTVLRHGSSFIIDHVEAMGFFETSLDQLSTTQQRQQE